jgi:tRNA 2-thiouridine synthesizing protein A
MTDKCLDLRREICPRPLILTMSTIKTLVKGEILRVEATDETMRKAIPKLCERAGFELLEVTEGDGFIRFRIRK